MTKISASDAKTRFGALLDQAQLEPVTIEKQGRPVAVMLSFQAYSEQQKVSPSEAERKKALRFLEKWAKRPAAADEALALDEDPRAKAIWEKYTRVE
ncbi:MAG: type II toxin-antitoxin system Phd/YefM family antitoxin [Akkermansiaceae bacterium]|jgi:prevent-host-death family protein|nr:type II toxin-antitoxin system Phd/YefM family antitoxin [Akkermansiaceae bacterium]MDP4646613.1 type II toxin-antitoxin system Phd/YefM family antitoxin [Akkermansiaceae bacterium]MDP4720188.1 type II toxin-antitoxin system Phd/YefM family antitoxin [Akkermansiaceae bacterium]MDP4779822.1 type II toxin-antitoxin system Phd/YefM family antitoxin [Akkermansiaceae bacterium]MDP4846391.1 type II toxin-antitoxin system Phd/YefM family antitoxin [Akkermansiaceae bacterium]